MPRDFQSISCSLSSRSTLAGDPTAMTFAGISIPAGTKAMAPTMLFSPIRASSITTAFIPISALRPM